MSNLYDLLGHAATPLAKQILKRRLARGKEDPKSMQEKLGHASGQGPVDVWLHAASVGELSAARPLLDELQRSGLSILVTTTTQSSAKLAKQWLQGMTHQFAPLDLPGPRRSFFDHWQPGVMVTIDSEIWPGWFDEARHRHIPSFIINGRMSQKSRAHWNKLRFLTGPVLAHAHLVVAQEEASASMFKKLGAPDVVVKPPLKLARATNHVTKEEPTHLVMASMHPEEADSIRLILEELKTSGISLPVCIIPRHPERIDEFGDITPNVHFETAFGQMDHWLARAKAVLVGGSFFDHGGQNPFEAVTHGLKPVIGPSHDNFAGMIRVLRGEQAILLASHEQEAASMLAHAVANPWRESTVVLPKLQQMGMEAVAHAAQAIQSAHEERSKGSKA